MQRRKKEKEFSKTILRTVAVATLVIVVFSFVLMWKTGDTSPLAYLIPGIFTELSAATGFYYWKAKAENQIKLDILRKENKLDDIEQPVAEETEANPAESEG